MIFSDENTPFDMRYASRSSSAASSSFQAVWQPGHDDPPEDSGEEKLDNLLFLIASGSKKVAVTPGVAHAAEGSATCNNASDRPTQPLEKRVSEECVGFVISLSVSHKAKLFRPCQF